MELEKWLIEFRPHDSHCEATVILSSKNWGLKTISDAVYWWPSTHLGHIGQSMLQFAKQ